MAPENVYLEVLKSGDDSQISIRIAKMWNFPFIGKANFEHFSTITFEFANGDPQVVYATF